MQIVITREQCCISFSTESRNEGKQVYFRLIFKTTLLRTECFKYYLQNKL